MPPPGAANPVNHVPVARAPPTSMHPPSHYQHDAAAPTAYIPGPNDIVRAPEEGESGPLAGINVQALRALLNPNGVAATIAEVGRNRAVFTEVGVGSGVGGAGGAGSVDVAGSTGGGGLQAASGVSPSTSRHARRLYVGNLPSNTTDVQIGDFFNRALIQAKGTEMVGDPVISVYMNLEKRFAFIETRTVAEAAGGLMLDGIKFGEVCLRVRRPNDFNAELIGRVEPPKGFNAGLLGVVSTQVSDGPNKVFIGGIPYNLTEDNVKELLQTFGSLAAFNLIKEPSSGMSKGFAFFEYADPAVVDVACNSLHGMQVGDKTLTVRRASQSGGGGVTSGATFASTASGLLLNGEGKKSGVGGDALDVDSLVTKATRVVELKNVASEEELADDEEFEEIREDMEEEAKKFGQLEEVLIGRPGEKGMEAAVGKVYLRYTQVEEAERAHATMSGRKFGERTVEAAFIDEVLFQRRHF